MLDSIAIMNQIIVGRELGAGRLDDAYAAGARMITLSTAVRLAFAAVLLVSADVIPRAFAGDAELAEAAVLWPLFALAQPLAGAVFALDGILIGAGDGDEFLAASMLLAFLCCGAVLLASLEWDWECLRGVWAALLVLICVRLAAMGSASGAAVGSSRAGRERRRFAAASGSCGFPPLAPVALEPAERLPERRGPVVAILDARVARRDVGARGGRERRLVHSVLDPLPPATERLAQPRGATERPRTRRSGSWRARSARGVRSRPSVCSRLEVELRRRSRAEARSARARSAPGRVAGVERPVPVEIGDVVPGVARRQERLEADDVTRRDPDVRLRHGDELAPKLVERHHRTACLRSLEARRVDQVRRAPTSET